MIPIIQLNAGVKEPPTWKKSWAIPFKTQAGKDKTIYVGLSVGKVSKGIFEVADFILKPDKAGLAVAIREGWTPTIGSILGYTPEDGNST